MLSLVGAYGMMVLSQNFGSDIVGLLHGPDAKLEAEVPPDDVAPGTSLAELCEGYANHHFDSVSNSFHAAGMAAGVVSLMVALFGARLSRGQRVASLFWMAPQWYLWAWLGHFWLQRDVPAVFTYGLTLKSYMTGEFCSIMWVCTGVPFQQKNTSFPGLEGTPPSTSFLVVLSIFLFGAIGAVTPPGIIWRAALSGCIGNKVKNA